MLRKVPRPRPPGLLGMPATVAAIRPGASRRRLMRTVATEEFSLAANLR